jgi:hypothetical protein
VPDVPIDWFFPEHFLSIPTWDERLSYLPRR